MSSGKRLKRKEKEILDSYGVNPDNWLVIKRPHGELHLVHRISGEKRVLKIK